MKTRTTLLIAIMLCIFAACTETGDPAVTGADGAAPPLASAGRWLTDAYGRVVFVHGFNEVSKVPPYYPAAFGFADDDAAFIAAEGFNAVRLGVDFRGLMPEPGVVDAAYIDHLGETVDVLAAQHIFILFDFHQDGFAPMFNGNGFPDWMAITDGLPNPPEAVFPLYYIQNPAMQRAFENFWANRSGPNGIGLQDYFVQGVEAVVARFADNQWVIGTELMNEPWPGAEWQPCIDKGVGCPELEQSRLVPFYTKATAAAQRLAPLQLVFVEPFVLFNFGQGPTTIPGATSGNALSFHSYALDLDGELNVLAYGVDAAERDRAAAVVTEFGAELDPVLINRLTGQMEAQRLPWLFWAYETIVDVSQPAGPDNLGSDDAFTALVRPYPVALTGTPTQISFDPDSEQFELQYMTSSPDGSRYPSALLSVVSIPARRYPNGYVVSVEGATVTSTPNAPLLTLRTDPGAPTVTLRVTRSD